MKFSLKETKNQKCFVIFSLLKNKRKKKKIESRK